MPTYVVKCPVCGTQEFVASIKTAGSFMECPICQRPRPQVIFAPQFQEDRVRLWKGPLGNGYSTALGEQMPQTRAERDRLAKQKGVEFCSKAELLADNKEAAEAVDYRQEVDAGGRREDWRPADLAPFVEKPDWAKPLVGET